MDIDNVLKTMVDRGASDLFIRPASPPCMRLNREVLPIEKGEPLSIEEVLDCIKEITPPELFSILSTDKYVEFAFYRAKIGRFRASIFQQRNTPSIVLRHIRPATFSFADLNLPSEVLEQLCHRERGLILVTGTTGSGKSTTIASMLEYINKNFSKHILTIEDPIEFIFSDKRCLFNQRQIGTDVDSYGAALKQAILQSPDIIYLANIRDQHTMEAAIMAGETGVLVFATLHTNNVVETLEKVVNFFPPHKSKEVLRQIANLINGIISLRLIKRIDGKGMVPAYEIMVNTPTIKRLINESQFNDIPKYLEDGEIYGMNSFKQSLVKLVKAGIIDKKEAIKHADSPDELKLALSDTMYGTYGTDSYA